MKKTLSTILLITILTAVFVPFVTADTSPSVAVYLDGVKLSFDVPPQIMDGSTMVPMRKIFEALEAEVLWDGATQTITAEKDGTKIKMQLGNTQMKKNGELISLQTAPLLIDDRTLVPVRAIAESFDADVQWNQKEYMVIITTNGIPVYPDYPNVPDFKTFFGEPAKADRGQYVYYQFNEEFIPFLQEMGFELVQNSSDDKATYISMENRICKPAVTISVRHNKEINYCYVTISAKEAYNPQPSPTPTPKPTPRPPVTPTPIPTYPPDLPLTNVYSADGYKMATIPEADLQYWLDAGWLPEYPLYGKEVWLSNIFVTSQLHDIYDVDTFPPGMPMPKWNKAVIKWYDDTRFTQLNRDEKQLDKTILLMNGAEYIVDTQRLVNTLNSANQYRKARWSNPKTDYGISDYAWNRIQNSEIWIGMSKNEFILSKGYAPDSINLYNFGYGETEQWVYWYSSGMDCYYFENGILTSYQI